MLTSAKSGIGIDEVLEAIVAPHPAAQGRPRRAAEGDARRQLVRSLSRRRHPHPRRSTARSARASRSSSCRPAPPTWSTASAPSAPRSSSSPSSAPARSASSPPRSRTSPRPASATPSPTRKRPAAAGAARLQGSPAGRVLRPVPGRRRRLREAAREHLTSCASTTPASASRWRPARRSGFGFRCGFLGLLHLEIIQERLTREYDLDLITTAPSVVYHIQLAHSTDEPAEAIELHNPADMPDPNRIASDRGAVDRGDDLRARRISRPDPQALPGPARHPEEPDLRRRPRPAHLRAAAERGGVRLLRPAEDRSAAAMPASTITRSATARATSSR